MRALVTGAGGLLGRALTRVGRRLGRAGGVEVIGLAHGDLDVTREIDVAKALDTHRPDVVLHCAAYTAVDRAESDADGAMALNRDAARLVAAAADRAGALTVYFSTDYVFDGRSGRPYLPDDEPAPLSVYGRTKLEGERAVMESASEALVVRTSWLYGPGGGFVNAILGRAERGEALRVVADQTGRPTWTENLAQTTFALVNAGARGVWHASDRGSCTWHELAVEACRIRGLSATIAPMSTEDYGAPAARPRYSVLDLERTETRLGRTLMSWNEALRRHLETTAG